MEPVWAKDSILSLWTLCSKATEIPETEPCTDNSLSPKWALLVFLLPLLAALVSALCPTSSQPPQGGHHSLSSLSPRQAGVGGSSPVRW